MIPPDPPTDDDDDTFKAALQADENHEAVYGWLAEETDEPSGPAPKC